MLPLEAGYHPVPHGSLVDPYLGRVGPHGRPTVVDALQRPGVSGDYPPIGKDEPSGVLSLLMRSCRDPLRRREGFWHRVGWDCADPLQCLVGAKGSLCYGVTPPHLLPTLLPCGHSLCVPAVWLLLRKNVECPRRLGAWSLPLPLRLLRANVDESTR